MNLSISVSIKKTTPAVLAALETLSRAEGSAELTIPTLDAGVLSKEPTTVQPVPVAAPTTPVFTPAVPMNPVPVAAPVAAPAVPMYPVPAAVPTIPAIAAAPVLTAPAAPALVPTSAPAYTFDDLAHAAAPLMDAGKTPDLLALLRSFNVQALTQLPKEQYGAFATALRGLGAKI